MSKRREIGKVLLIPDFKGNTFQIKLFSYTKWLLGAFVFLLICVVSLSIYQYKFYQGRLYSLLTDQTDTSSSLDQISRQGIQTKRELMRLKNELEGMEKFIASAGAFDKDATAKLSIPFSSMTFTDYFRSNAVKYDQSHPASSSDKPGETKEDMARNLKNSQERQASFRNLMDITPSGYPLEGTVMSSHGYIEGIGIALQSPVGTPIHATATGKVVTVKSIDKVSFLVEIEHPAEKNRNVKTIYHFCTHPTIKVGQSVKKGQLIAYSGFYPNSSDNVFCYQVLINKLFIQPK